MEHVIDMDEVMRHLAAGLGSGGLLKISVPAQKRVRRALSQITEFRTPDPSELDPVFPFEHVNAFTAEGLEALDKRFGLRRVTPTRSKRFAYLSHQSSLSVRYPRNALKEFARPFTPFLSSRKLTMWFEAPVESSAAADHQ